MTHDQAAGSDNAAFVRALLEATNDGLVDGRNRTAWTPSKIRSERIAEAVGCVDEKGRCGTERGDYISRVEPPRGNRLAIRRRK